jgi:hypothetical protein
MGVVQVLILYVHMVQERSLTGYMVLCDFVSIFALQCSLSNAFEYLTANEVSRRSPDRLFEEGIPHRYLGCYHYLMFHGHFTQVFFCCKIFRILACIIPDESLFDPMIFLGTLILYVIMFCVSGKPQLGTTWQFASFLYNVNMWKDSR